MSQAVRVHHVQFRKPTQLDPEERRYRMSRNGVIGAVALAVALGIVHGAVNRHSGSDFMREVPKAEQIAKPVMFGSLNKERARDAIVSIPGREEFFVRMKPGASIDALRKEVEEKYGKGARVELAPEPRVHGELWF